MTSGQESSNLGVPPAPYSEIESLAGVFHPHVIEVQDFSYYALMIDVRSRAEYDDDHIPGAVQLMPPEIEAESSDPAIAGNSLPGGKAAADASAAGVLPERLAALVAPVKRDQAILLYCGRGGRDSQPLAKALRWRGWTVDVLPGGWINYRRWVQAGLEVLPRLVTFRVIASSLGSEVARVLNAMRELEHQVLDVEGLAGSRHGELVRSAREQPSQAWFESQLLHAIRGLDPRAPVWVGDTNRSAGSLVLPGALVDAMAFAPSADLHVEPLERVRCWREDEPLLAQEPAAIIEALVALKPPPTETLLATWRQLVEKGLAELLAPSLLSDYLNPLYAEQAAMRSAGRHAMAPLVIDSFSPAGLMAAVRAWLPSSASDPTVS